MRGLLRRWNHRNNRRAQQKVRASDEWTAPATEEAEDDEEAWGDKGGRDDDDDDDDDRGEPSCTTVEVEVGGEMREIEIDLRNLSSIDELQEEVAIASIVWP